MFDLNKFIQDCKNAVADGGDQRAVREIVANAVSTPVDIFNALGEPKEASVSKLYHAPNLTILNIVWAPLMTIMPHNHNMWAVIGIYTGCEDNIFWRRIGNKVEGAGAKALRAGDVATLGADIIHSVTNPAEEFTGAIHVYGGDFFETPRSEWEPVSLTEKTYDVEKNMRLFQEANARFAHTAS